MSCAPLVAFFPLRMWGSFRSLPTSSSLSLSEASGSHFVWMSAEHFVHTCRRSVNHDRSRTVPDKRGAYQRQADQALLLSWQLIAYGWHWKWKMRLFCCFMSVLWFWSPQPYVVRSKNADQHPILTLHHLSQLHTRSTWLYSNRHHSLNISYAWMLCLKSCRCKSG